MPSLRTIWLYIRWPLAVLAVFYILLVLYRIPAVGEQQRTDEMVTKIQSQKITLSDVIGDALPPVPNTEENNATVEGIDKNNNGIRDDVELAIFKLHASSSKIRAAELQYAMTEQMFLTDVFNTDTWKAVAEEDSRAFNCISETYPRDDMNKYIQITDGYTKEVESLVFNTQLRIDAKSKAFDFTTSFGAARGISCDIDLSSLPN